MSSEGTMSAWERRKMYWKNIATNGKPVEAATSGEPEKVPATKNTSKPGQSKTADQKPVVKKTVKPDFIVPQSRPPKPAPSTSLPQVSRKPAPPVARNRSMSVPQLNVQPKKHKLEGATNDLPNKRFKATPLPTNRRATLGAATRPPPVISRRVTDVQNVVPTRPAPPRPKSAQQKTTPAARQPVQSIKRNYYAVPSRVETGLKRRQTQLPTFLVSKRLSISGASAPPQPAIKRGRNSAPLPVKAKAFGTTPQPSAKPKLPKAADLEETKKNKTEQLGSTPNPDRRGSYTISRISEESGELLDQELEPQPQKPVLGSALSDAKGSEQQFIPFGSKSKGVAPTNITDKNQDQIQFGAEDDDISKENQTSNGRMTRARRGGQAEIKQTPVKNVQKAKSSRRAKKEPKVILTRIKSTRAATDKQEDTMLTRNGKSPRGTTLQTAAVEETPKEANVQPEENQKDTVNSDEPLEDSTIKNVRTPKLMTRMAATSEGTPNAQDKEKQEGLFNNNTQLATTTTKSRKTPKRTTRNMVGSEETPKEANTQHEENHEGTINNDTQLAAIKNIKTPKQTTRKTAVSKETAEANTQPEENQEGMVSNDTQLATTTTINSKTPNRTTRKTAVSEVTEVEANTQREENQEGMVSNDTQLATATTKNSKTPKRTTRKTAASEETSKETNPPQEEDQEGIINDTQLATANTKNSKTPKRTTRKTAACEEIPEETNIQLDNNTEPESSKTRNTRTPKPRTPQPSTTKLTPKENVQFDGNQAEAVKGVDIRPETSKTVKTSQGNPTVVLKRLTPKTPKSVLKRRGTSIITTPFHSIREDNGLVQNQENVPPSKNASVVTPGKPMGTGSKRPKNVSFHMVPENPRTSVTLPKTPRRELSLREKLENFLDKKGCSVSRHRHLRCFGYQLSELRQNKSRPRVSESCTSENASPNLRMRRSLDKSRPSESDTPVEESVVAILNELKTVLLMGQSVSEGSEWLKKLEECSSSAINEQAAYWVVKALLEEQAGKYQRALDIFTQAVERYVQPFDELKQALDDFTERLSAKEVGVTRQDSAALEDEGVADPEPGVEDVQAEPETSPNMSARRSGKGASQKRSRTRSKALKNLGSPMEATIIKYTMQDASSIQSLSNKINVGSPNLLAVITPIRRSVRLTRSSHRKTRRSFNLEDLPEPIQNHIARTPKAYI